MQFLLHKQLASLWQGFNLVAENLWCTFGCYKFGDVLKQDAKVSSDRFCRVFFFMNSRRILLYQRQKSSVRSGAVVSELLGSFRLIRSTPEPH